MDRSMTWTPHQHHRRGHSLGGGAMREKDEDLALFKDMGKQRDKPQFLCTEDQLLDASLLTEFGGLSHPHSAPPAERKGIGAELLNSDADKTDYDWLMTPPGTPLFPSLDADSPALQHGALINRSLAAIKTSRQVGSAPRARSPAPNLTRGNPSPSRRPSTPQNGIRSNSERMPATKSHTSNNNRPATPTRSSTPSSRASPNIQPRPSTPTRQSTPTARPVTPLGARPATPTRRPATPTRAPSNSTTPTLRRSVSSPNGRIRNPSPTRSTASTATSTAGARGVSPARSLPSRGISPARGVSPAPHSRGRSPSPSLRAPYPVDASDDIPPNLRTTSDRPSSAQRRAVAYGASPGEGRVADPVRRTPSPARSAATVSSGLSRTVESRASRAASSDSESSFDTCSQSGVSTFGILTPERSGSRGRMFGRGTVDYGRSRRGGSSTSPQLGPSASKKSFESAAREYHRGQVAAFRPLMTNSSISTFYSSRASGLLRRPLTPSSTASSSEHGATVAHDSEMDDEDAGSHWKPSNVQASGAHSPLHLFDKSLRESSIVDDNDELSSFFRTPEALHVKSIDLVVSKDEFESPELVVSPELNWLNSRNDNMEYNLRSKNVDSNHQAAPSGLEQIRDKLRHLKNTAAENHEDAEPASRLQLQAQSVTDSLSSLRSATALVMSVADDGDTVSEPMEGVSCEVCSCPKRGESVSQTWRGCHCNATTTTTSQELAGESSSSNVENDSKAANMVYAKERDIWYIYRHSSEYEVPVAGFSETKMEINPPQILAKEVHMRARITEFSPPSVSASAEDASPTVYSEGSSSKGHKENVIIQEVAMECVTSNIAEGGNVSTPGKEVDGELVADGVEDGTAALNRRMLEDVVGARSESMSQSGSPAVESLKKGETERANQIIQIPDEQCDKESTQACSSSENVSKPLHMSSEPPQNSPMPALHSSSVPHRATVANTISPSFEAEKKPEILGQPSSQGGGQVDYGGHRADAQASQAVSSVTSRHNLALNAEEQNHLRTESSSRSAKEGASEQGLPVHVRVTHTPPETHWNEDHVSVIPQVKKIIWQEEDLQPQPQPQFGTLLEAGTVHSRADEHERKCREGDEEELGWGNGKVEDMFFVGGYRLEGSVESQRQVAPTHALNGVKPKTPRADDPGSFFFEPLELVGQKCLLTGEVHIDSALYATAHLSHDSLVIKVQSSDGRVLALDNPARLISQPDDVNSYAVYQYSHWTEVGEQLTFSAHHGREEENSSSEILFYPKEHHVHVTEDEKQPKIPEFQGRPGMHVKRSVAPAPDGSQITVVPEKDNAVGGLKSVEIAASTITGSDGPLYDDTEFFPQAASAGFQPSWQHNPELLNAPEACATKATQSKPGVPSTQSKPVNDAAKTGLQEVRAGNVPSSRNGEFQQSNSKEVVVDQRLDQRASLDETTSTADHFDYIFECLGSKSDPRSPQALESPLVPELMPSATSRIEISNSAIVKPSSLNGVSQSTAKTNGTSKGSEKQTSKEKTPPSSTKCNSRADSEQPVVVSSSPNSKVAVEAPVKEEIVESAELSPNPGTRKHMSSFKFSHKKTSITNAAELKRSNTTKLGTQFGNGQQQQQQQSEHSVTVLPGSKKSVNTTSKLSVNGNSKPAAVPSSPQLNKGRSVRAASPARAPTNAKAVPHNSGPGNNGVVPPEEPSIHSRFSNITVRSGSDTENFDWGPSSLEETSSRCGSSSSTNPASMAILSPGNSSQPLYHEDNGDHASGVEDDDDEEEEDEVQQQVSDYSPLRRSADVFYEEQTSSVLDQTSLLNLHENGRIRTNPGRNSAHHVVVEPMISAVNSSSIIPPAVRPRDHCAPKQNLDKLSEKLEQLETFGARVMLRNPQQQFLHSPPRAASKPEPRSNWQPADPPRPAASGNSRSHSRTTVRLDRSAMSMSKPNKCRCTIL